MAKEVGMEAKEGMSELIASSQFDFNFSYGGNTISAEEMLVRACFLCTGKLLVPRVFYTKLSFTQIFRWSFSGSYIRKLNTSRHNWF